MAGILLEILLDDSNRSREVRWALDDALAAADLGEVAGCSHDIATGKSTVDVELDDHDRLPEAAALIHRVMRGLGCPRPASIRPCEPAVLPAQAPRIDPAWSLPAARYPAGLPYHAGRAAS